MQQAVVSRSNNFDLLRLLAALQVVYLHGTLDLGLPQGWRGVSDVILSLPGVPIFFVISGFLVTDAYLRAPSFGMFARNRALRIYPGLLVNIAILDFAMYLTHGMSFASGLLNYLGYYLLHGLTAADDWPRYFFISPYQASTLYAGYPSGVLWTLTVELSFYLALPAFLVGQRKVAQSGTAALALGAAGSLLASQFFNVSTKMHPVISITVIPYFWIFAVGVFARLYWPQLRHLFERRAVWWGAAHLGGTVIAIAFAGDGTLYIHSPSLLTVVRIMVLAGMVLSLAFTAPRPELLGGLDISYGMYLYHMLAIQTLKGFGLSAQAWLWPVIYASAIGAGTLSCLLVERPALTLRRRPSPALSS